MTKSVNGSLLRKMMYGGYAAIEKNREYVDSLNVFPVPDGDTGVNMTLTMKSVLKELEATKSQELDDVANAINKGALKGARGNSGVILSQILKGMMTAIARPVDDRMMTKVIQKTKTAITGNTPVTNPRVTINVPAFAKSLSSGSKVAYAAVTVPKEGTILTVIRVMGEEAQKLASAKMTFEDFFEKIMVVGEDILAKTPDMLPVLKKAGVVDSGGRGLLIIFGGFLAALLGKEEIVINFDKDSSNPGGGISGVDGANLDDLDDIEFAYCTQFNIINMNKTTTMASIDRLREKMCEMGDSVACVGDLELVNLHVHTNTPGEAITQALMLGEVSEIKIENMLEQNRELRASRNMEDKDQGIAVVAAGEGVCTVFKDLGVDYVIKGGQTMNPSAEDIAKACDRVYAKTVYIFPNNKNIILAARHAQELSKKNLVVIPTRTINEGISACIAFDPDASIEDNTDAFHEAASAVKSASITYAVRTTKFGNYNIKEGEIMGMDSSNIIAKGQTISETTMKVLEKLVQPSSSSITLFFGEGVKEADSEKLKQKIEEKYPNHDITMVDGGQPVYYYLISIE